MRVQLTEGQINRLKGLDDMLYRAYLAGEILREDYAKSLGYLSYKYQKQYVKYAKQLLGRG